MQINDINDEGLRLLANLAQHYGAWRDAARQTAEGRLAWKTVSDREYLYRIVDSKGNGKSLGPRSPENEALFESDQIARQTEKRAWDNVLQDGALYRALRLPRIASFAGEILRELDIESMLGSPGVLVVGTNAMAAYAIEATALLPTHIDATKDFDLTWVANEDRTPYDPTLFGALKKVDSTYTINAERTFQARNADGEEVELLLPESLKRAFPRHERFRPIPLPEQDWLLPGTRVDHVACGMDGKPARIVAPDPRWFALHKRWLSRKPSRDRLKVTKDEEQGLLLLDLVRSRMPRFPLDAAFRQSLPPELVPWFDDWARSRAIALD